MDETCLRIRGLRKFLLLLIACMLLWIMMETFFQLRNRISASMRYSLSKQSMEDTPVMFASCEYLLPRGNRSKGRVWAEDTSLNEIPVTDHMVVANASLSKFSILNRKKYYLLGEEIHVLVEMYDGYGERKKFGGDMLFIKNYTNATIKLEQKSEPNLITHVNAQQFDLVNLNDMGSLVRVWMRDRKLNSSAASSIHDNGNGTYTATLVAFWPGVPEIKAVLIHPKEVIDTYFRRRFKCPQVQHMTAIFEHPVNPLLMETTICNLVDFIPGYKEVCNLTRDNYNSPLYCGKPTNRRLQCSDWTKVGKRLLWPDQEQNLTLAERFLLQPENKATCFPGLESVLIKEEKEVEEELTKQSKKCYEVEKRNFWNRSSPIGYFYHGVWYDSLCPGHAVNIDTMLRTCLQNRTMYLFGDSTVRQWHYCIQERINCTFMTDTWDESHKHRPVTCIDRTINFTLHWSPHGLPFFSDNTPRRFYRPIATALDDMSGEANTIVLIHIFAHMMSFHSSVFYERMLIIRDAIQRFFYRNPTATVILKGPHYYSFEKKSYQSLWMLDKYAEIYTNILTELFKDLADRVIYIDCIDITISAETQHIHPTKETVKEMVDSMFHKICQY